MTMTKIKAQLEKCCIFVVKFSEIDEILSSSIFEDAKAKPMTSGANSQSKGTSGIDPRLWVFNKGKATSYYRNKYSCFCRSNFSRCAC